VILFIILEKVPKISNRPIGEKSSNLVTLFFRRFVHKTKFAVITPKQDFLPDAKRHFDNSVMERK
jgi:hypothetical protein